MKIQSFKNATFTTAAILTVQRNNIKSAWMFPAECQLGGIHVANICCICNEVYISIFFIVFNHFHPIDFYRVSMITVSLIGGEFERRHDYNGHLDL